jgi:hypothetical protein
MTDTFNDTKEGIINFFQIRIRECSMQEQPSYFSLQRATLLVICTCCAISNCYLLFMLFHLLGIPDPLVFVKNYTIYFSKLHTGFTYSVGNWKGKEIKER